MFTCHVIRLAECPTIPSEWDIGLVDNSVFGQTSWCFSSEKVHSVATPKGSFDF